MNDSSEGPAGESGRGPTDGELLSAPKFRTDRSHYAGALQAWMARTFPERVGLAVSDIEVPVSTGFSNETVILDVAWSADGSDRAERSVVRIEPADGGMFPPQTPHCAVSVELRLARGQRSRRRADRAHMGRCASGQHHPAGLR